MERAAGSGASVEDNELQRNESNNNTLPGKEPPEGGRILLEVENLKKYYPLKGGIITHTTGYIHAVDGVSFSVREGETLGLVGESGCGKSTIGRQIVGLERPTEGIIRYDGNGQTVVEEDCIREREPERNFDAVSPEWTEKPEGGTSFLSKAREPGLFLRSESAAYPDLRITKDSFLIGKKKDAVDGWLKARGISRIHGRISREEDCYYLTDLNSTNGTYLNGGRLEVNEKARLRPGDCVGFADVRYVVEG